MKPIRTERLELVGMSGRFLELLLAGRRGEAGAVAGIAIPDGWPDEHDARFLGLRAKQLREEPSRAEWPVRAVTLREPSRPMIGHAGFHGPPGINGLRKPNAVEIGYTIFEPYRRRGFATETVRALIEWARSEHAVHHFIASIAPDNTPSLALVQRLGFVRTGEVWDDEDGRELVFELETRGLATA
jgi:ribosomal-protein-alanine N-acetyltransferase